MAFLKLKPPTKGNWFYFFLIAFTVALLIWAWRGVSLGDVWRVLSEIQYGWLVLGVVTFIAAFSVRALRWGVLLGTHRHPGSFRLRQAAVFIGFAGNCILPANAGEILRATIMRRFAAIPLGAALGSILTARLLDAAVAFILLLTPLLFSTSAQQTHFATLPIVWLGVALIILWMIFSIAAKYPQQVAKIVGDTIGKVGLGRFRVSIVKIVATLLTGLEVLCYPRRTIIAVLYTFGIWGLSGITFWTALIAFDITTPGLPGALFIQSIQAIAAIIPSLPGHLGTFEATIRFALGVYGIAPDITVAYTLIMRLLMHGSLIVVGLLFALKLGLTEADLKMQKANVPQSKSRLN